MNLNYTGDIPEGLTQRAEYLAELAHTGQADKQGRDYALYHLRPVAEWLRPYGEHAYAAGMLHDILEDTEADHDTLVAWGFPYAVIDAVDAVTRLPHEPYEALISRACAHPLGRLVKLADNWVNLTGLDDLAKIDPETAERLRVKYTSARVRLESALIGEA